jgi:hypothetical protein
LLTIAKHTDENTILSEVETAVKMLVVVQKAAHVESPQSVFLINMEA